MTIAAFPGTFDPITLGHESLIGRAVGVFDRVLVCVAAGRHKRTIFNHKERVEMVRGIVRVHGRRVRVLPFSGLLAPFLRKNDCRVILRGLRAVSDFEFEAQLAGVNAKLDGTLETLMMTPKDNDHLHISSTIVREIAALGGESLEKFVSPTVARQLREKVRKNNYGAADNL